VTVEGASLAARNLRRTNVSSFSYEIVVAATEVWGGEGEAPRQVRLMGHEGGEEEGRKRGWGGGTQLGCEGDCLLLTFGRVRL
jgi:hypothetical protein